jgi:hypothetical protein
MSRRLWIVVIAVVVAALVIGGPWLALSTDHSKPEQQTPALDLASKSASAFLNRYVDADGRVKIDAGQETQAQAQGWALLIAAASGDSAHYKSLLGWTNNNVPTSSRNRGVNLDIAWSLAVAAQRLGDPQYTGQANAMVPDIVNAPPSGPSGVNNDVFFLALDQLQNSTEREQVRALADNQRQGIENEMKLSGTSYGSLPLNAAAGNYSADAMNQPLNLATSCNPADKAADLYIWTKLRVSRDTRSAMSLSPTGKVIDDTKTVRATVASAAAAQAAGEQLQSLNLLNDADGLEQLHPSTEAAAWDALGRMFVTTNWLGSC